MYLYVDIETLPDMSEGAAERAASNLKVPGNYKKPESIAAYIEENAPLEWRRTSLNGGYGELLCIGYAVDDGEPATLARDDYGTESDLLLHFLSVVAAQASGKPITVVGHNILWDLKFLYHRAALMGLVSEYAQAGLPINPSPYGGQVIDTMQLWTWSNRDAISLSELCSILGVELPTHQIDGLILDGSTVFDFHEKGWHEVIYAYCADDVAAAREVHKLLTP